MKSKNLVLTNGIVGLVGGIILLFGVWFMAGGAIAGSESLSGSVIFLDIIKIALIVLGILALIYYKGDTRVGVAPSVLILVGGAIGLIPFLGWIGGIIAIVGGSIYLAKLKNFKN